MMSAQIHEQLQLSCTSQMVRNILNNNTIVQFKKFKEKSPLPKHHKNARLDFAQKHLIETCTLMAINNFGMIYDGNIMEQNNYLPTVKNIIKFRWILTKACHEFIFHFLNLFICLLIIKNSEIKICFSIIFINIVFKIIVQYPGKLFFQFSNLFQSDIFCF